MLYAICLFFTYCLIPKNVNLNAFFFFAESWAGYNEKKLLHKLLDHYNVLERPVANESDPLQLSFGLTLMQIIDVVSTII